MGGSRTQTISPAEGESAARLAAAPLRHWLSVTPVPGFILPMTSRYPPELATTTSAGRSIGIRAKAPRRQVLHACTKRGGWSGTSMDGTGQPDLTTVVSSQCRRLEMSSRELNHCMACESPKSTTRRVALVSPKLHVITAGDGVAGVHRSRGMREMSARARATMRCKPGTWASRPEYRTTDVERPTVQAAIPAAIAMARPGWIVNVREYRMGFSTSTYPAAAHPRDRPTASSFPPTPMVGKRA